ncbi:tetratricopeptide repeat protein [Paracerasibacillus soli]|uniref:Tetratricopeptide repeat protein n=2 Tax=Paracerasibacillus soli TaxID=480284 RepID=A0ABU5CVK3_9BACI|nr:hypothetical protein [Virgibacillus soli]MDY0409433.1 hypothetical protein [Virgibacillus soli]
MIKDKAIETFHKVKIRVYKNKSVNYYLEKGNNLLETGKVNKAYRVFKRCLRDFPTDEKIHASIIKYALQTGKLDLVNVHWGKIDNFKKVNLPADAYINYAKMLQKYNDLQRAMDILILGVTTCSDNKEILSVISEQMPIETNDQISNKSKKLLDEFVDQAIQNRDWNMSIQRIEEVCSIYKQNVQFKYQIKLSMLYQVVGSHRQASHILNRLLHKYSEEILEDEKGYRKIVLYDNGESRI